MHRGKVTVGISKGWVDLDGPAVALHGSCDVLHLFQRVAHIAVCISKVRVDPAANEKQEKGSPAAACIWANFQAVHHNQITTPSQIQSYGLQL